MPNRIIKESICRSDEINNLSWFEEVLFYRLMVNCDDYGRFDGRMKIIKGSCFPLKDIKESELLKSLQSLSANGLIIRYEADGKPIIQLRTWEKHQQIRSKKSKYPAPDGECVNMISNDINCNQMISDDSICPRNPIQSNPNPNTNQYIGEKNQKFSPPTVEEVRAYCIDRKNNVDADNFVNFYAAKGWMVGKNKMKDWKACVRTWEKNRNDKPSVSNAKIHNFEERRYDYGALEKMFIQN